MAQQVITSSGSLKGSTNIYDRVLSSVSNLDTATETTMYSKSITGGDMSTNKLLRLTMLGTFKADSAGFAKNLTVRIKFGGSTVATITYSPADNASTWPFRIVAYAHNLTASSQFVHGEAQIGYSGASMLTGYGTAAVDTSTAQTLAVTAQWDLANATREVKIYSAILELL